MFSPKNLQHKSSINLLTKSCIGLNYHSKYNWVYRAPHKKKPRNLYKMEDPESSMDMAYLQPHVKKWKNWKWSWNALTSAQYSHLKRLRDKKKEKYERMEKLPYYFDQNDPKKLNVIFVRDMDEYLAGEIAKVSVGIYRHWLWPQKIALPATTENIERWQHLNKEQREEREMRQKMEKLSNDISTVRLEMKIRRDPDNDQVYGFISKQKICRKLLLFKNITIKPEQLRITKLTTSVLSQSDDDISLNGIDDAGSYNIQLLLDETYDYKFELRVNVRYNDLPKENRTPFLLNEDDGDDDGDDDDEGKDDDETIPVDKPKRILSKEMKFDLKKWSRRKRSNEMLDHLVDRSSRYSDLYSISKLDLTQNTPIVDDEDSEDSADNEDVLLVEDVE